MTIENSLALPAIPLWRRMVNLDRMAAGAVAGAVAGVVIGGVGARLAMRGVALAIGNTPGFTAEGSILVLFLGLFLGLPAGLLFAVVERWLPGRAWAKGLLYGGALSVLLCLPFFLIREGEFGLLSPWFESALFGSIALCYGLSLPYLIQTFERRFGRGRTVTVGWFGAFVMALLLAGAAFLATVGSSMRMPAVMHGLLGVSGSSMADVAGAQTLAGVLLMFGYLGLCGLLFWHGSGTQAGRLGAVLLLLVGATLFNQGRTLYGLWSFALPDVIWTRALVRAMGLSALVGYWLALPVPLPRWTWFVGGAVVIFTTIWLAWPAWSEWTLWGGWALLVGAILVAKGIQRRHAEKPGLRAALAWSMIGCALAGGAWLGLWAFALAPLPGWGLSNMWAINVALGVTFFWLPWLVLPLTGYLGFKNEDLPQ